MRDTLEVEQALAFICSIPRCAMECRGTQCLKPNTSCMPSAPGRAHCNAGISFAQESDKCPSNTWHQPYGSCNDRPVEADLGRSGLCRQTSLADGELQTAPEAEKKALLEQLHRQKFETIADMTDRFVQHFTTLHLERVYRVNVYICAVCLAASRTLAGICEAVRKDPQGRRVALNNDKFMKLLVKLCKLESSGWPSICTVTDREMREFYGAQAHRKLHGTVSILEDEQSEELWKCIIGKAAKSIRPLTYAIRVKGAPVLGSSSCVWHKDRNEQPPQERLLSEPEAARRVNPFPVSDLKTLDVVRCIDARHLIVYCSSRGKESVDTLNLMMAEFHRDLTSVPREDPPNVGDIVGLLESRDCLLRMLVVEVAEEMAVVWSMDQGDFRRHHWNSLVDLLPSFRCLPPAVGLGVLPDVNAVPSLKLLRECVKTFQTLTDHSSHEASFHAVMTTRLKDCRAIEVLSSLLNCPDFDTRSITAKFLRQLCCRDIGRQAVSEVGCVDIVLGRLRKLVDMQKRQVKDHRVTREMLSLVMLLQSMFFCNEELRLDYADSDHIALLSEIHHDLPHACQLSQEIDYCLRTLLGPAYNKCRLSAKPKLVAMTPEKLTDRSLSDVPSLVMQQYNEKKAAGRFYQHGSLVPFRCDETHELRPVRTMQMASLSTLAKVVCSFLNSWKLCIVYYGISREGLVHGVMLNHRERDALRLGIDDMTRRLRPCLMPQSIDVEFVPVLRTREDSRETVSCFVVEVKVRGAPDTMYTTSDGNCYLRDGDMSYQATTQDVRAWVVQKEEARYLQALGLAPLGPLRSADVNSPSKNPWHRVVY